jgi:hypothetical protein
MPFPSIDFELMYWRARRRLQRVRFGWRARMDRIRAEMILRCLHQLRQRPEHLTPEENFAFRTMWAVVVAIVVLVITLEVIGQEEFEHSIGAAHSITAVFTHTKV